MRVCCREIDGYDVEGEVIAGEDFDSLYATCDLKSSRMQRQHKWCVPTLAIDCLLAGSFLNHLQQS